jgi:hypothetical protein
MKDLVEKEEISQEVKIKNDYFQVIFNKLNVNNKNLSERQNPKEYYSIQFFQITETVEK